MAAVTVSFKGWNSSSQSWGGGPWGQDVGLLAATASVGSVTVTVDAIIDVTGVSATGSVGQVLVYGRVVPDQNPTYTEITPSQSPTWLEEAPNQSANWTKIAA